jgi:hypothetical protein
MITNNLQYDECIASIITCKRIRDISSQDENEKVNDMHKSDLCMINT